MPRSNFNSVIYFITDTLLSTQETRRDGQKLAARTLNFNTSLQLHGRLPELDDKWIAFLLNEGKSGPEEFKTYLEKNPSRAMMAFSGSHHGALDLGSLLAVVFSPKKVQEFLPLAFEGDAGKAKLTYSLRSQFGEYDLVVGSSFRFV